MTDLPEKLAPFPACSSLVRLSFDGRRLALTSATTTTSCSAASGKRGSDFSIEARQMFGSADGDVSVTRAARWGLRVALLFAAVWIAALFWLDVTEIADLFASDDPYPLQADGTRANMELWIGWRGLLVVNLFYGALPVALLASCARLLRRFGPRGAAAGASGQPVR